MEKTDIKKQLRAQLNDAGCLHPVANSANLPVFVQMRNVGQTTALLQQAQDLRDKFGDELADERALALEILDENGEPFFDPENDEDMILLRDMPFALRVELATAAREVNDAVHLKKIWTAAKHS